MTRGLAATVQYLRAHYSNPHYAQTPPAEDALLVAARVVEETSFLKNFSTARYYPRAQKHYRVVLAQFADFLKGTMLDMGSRTDILAELTGRPVTRFDKNNPELQSFDWERVPLPVRDASFDAVLCLDTLEHIDTIHAATDDLFRVAKRSVVISLPNCWKQAVKGIVRGRWEHAAYGIPLEKPMDRHKWFFNPEEALGFLAYRAHRAGWRIAKVCFHVSRETWWQRALYPWMFYIIPERYAKNWFTGTLFVALVPQES